MRIFGYLFKHKLALSLVIACLIVQAFTDLELPLLTSQIVDVGIQQAGVEHVAVDEMSAQSFENILEMVPEDDRSLLQSSYAKTEEGNYRLTDEGKAHVGELDSLLAFPLAAIHDRYRPSEGSWPALIADYKEGALSREHLMELIDQARSEAESQGEDLVLQQGIAAARAEYEDLGYNMTDMQIGFLLRVGLMMLGFAALGMVMAIMASLVASRTGASIGFDLRNRLFSRVVSFGDKEINHFSAASLITRGTNDIQLIQNVSIMLMRMVLYAPILAVGGVVMVMVTNASMGWIIVVAIIAVFIIIMVVFKVVMPKFRIMQKLIDRVNLVAREALTGVAVIRAFGHEAYEEKRFDTASTELLSTQLFTNRVMTFLMPSLMLVMNCTSACIIWIGSQYVDFGMIQTGDLIAFITYSMVIIMGFLMLGMISIMLPRADVAAERVNQVIECEPVIQDPAESEVQSLPLREGLEIAFHDVSFSYDDSDEKILESVSFTAHPGETLAIIGSTGSGKTTLLKLIERFYDVSSGSITLNGVDVRDLPQKTLRSQFGYIPQKAFLFSGTIYSNVSYADPFMDEERVEKALSIAQALDFVNDREDGADSAIAQGGTNVSGGQRQRLSIARALASDAKAYLFDDSFSALDYKTDARLRQELDRNLAGATKIIVAQRIATIMGADQIVVLEDGRVVGCGTHEELLDSCEEYREIALSQLSAEELQGVGRDDA